MHGKRVLFALLFVAAVFAANSCTSAYTSISPIQEDRDYAEKPISSCMVVGIAMEPEKRDMYEDEMALALKRVGVRAVAGHSLVPAGREQDVEALRRAAREAGVQTVMLTYMRGVVEKDVQVEPSSYEVRPVAVPLGNGYRMAYSHVHTTPVHQKMVTVRLKTDLYDVKTEKIIWSAATSTINPQSGRDVIASKCEALMKSLKKSGFVD